MVTETLKNFDLKQIAQSGQCFRMTEIKPGTFQVIAYGKRLLLEQEGQQVTFHCTEREYKDLWRRYFDLETNYQYFIDHIDPEDAYLAAAVQCSSGIRILRQELWETVVSFIISQNNNIPRIQKSIEKLCEFCGKGHEEPSGMIWYEFPSPEALAHEEDLGPAKLGYRAKYIAALAKNVIAGTVSLDSLAHMDQTEAGNYLKSIYGVGSKVASCIQLFSLHQLDSFPIDTWIKQIINEEYAGKFPAEAYSGFTGVIQQYIFNYARQQSGQKSKTARGGGGA